MYVGGIERGYIGDIERGYVGGIERGYIGGRRGRENVTKSGMQHAHASSCVL